MNSGFDESTRVRALSASGNGGTLGFGEGRERKELNRGGRGKGPSRSDFSGRELEIERRDKASSKDGKKRWLEKRVRGEKIWG